MEIRNRYFLVTLILSIIVISCSSTDTAVSNQDSFPEADEWISLQINEVIEFEFQKFDTSWTGNFKTYILNGKDERVLQSHHIAAEDSSWQYFELFVDFLKLYEIPPQHKIEGWVPDSGNLPKRVYNFEVYDGDSTKYFSYQDPLNDIRDYWQSQNVLTFVTFVQNDLNWVEAKFHK